MEEEDNIIVKWAQEDVETSYNLLNNKNNNNNNNSLTRLNLHPNTYIKLQKSVILGTCSIVRNFLKYK